MEAITLAQLGPLMGLLTGYALAIGGIVEGVKKMIDSGRDERPAWLTRFLPLIPMVLGAATGSLVLPMLFAWSGMSVPTADEMITLGFHCVMGAGVGSFAGQIYKSWDSMGGAGRAVQVLTSQEAEEEEDEDDKDVEE